MEETLDYWQHPDDANDPRHYLERTSAQQRSRFVVEWVSDLVAPDATLFEIGCNVGRNLQHLHRAGFRNLSGLEINKEAVDLFREHFPETAATTTIHLGSAETLLPKIESNAFDLTFTMAVLEHIHTESEWIFEHIARITRTWLLTIEDEREKSWRHFPRNYRKVFEALGLSQTKHLRLNLETHGLGPAFHARLFRVPAG